jgi:hypothetical protein
MKCLPLTIILGFAMGFSSVAQTIDYKSRIETINKNIYNNFIDKPANLYLETNSTAANKGNHSFLWPLCA